MKVGYSDKGFYINYFSHGDYETHSHDFFELAYVYEGEGLHRLNGKDCKVKKGMYFIVDYKKPHSYHNIKGGKLKLINCLFTAEFIDKSLKNCHRFSEILNSYLLKYDLNLLMTEPTETGFYDDDGTVFELLSKIMREYKNEDIAYLENIRLQLLEIIIITLRKITDNSKISKSDIIKYICSRIEIGYNTDIRLSALAKEANYSFAHLSRKFKEVTGMTFVEYLQKTRIKEGCRMLVTTDKKVIEIAEICGYTDVNTFCKLFKKYVGTTPRKFRMEEQK